MRKIADYLTKNRSGKDKKTAQSTHENEYIKPRKTFWRNSKQLNKLHIKSAANCCKSEEQAKKICKSFAYLKKSLYLCTRFKKTMINIAEWSSW
ncbi:hypothetical protein B5G04_06830 [Bacteroides sp. An51A]|nr:hypothetical protein B5G04_06830 [Bacteroides sp. An51A]